MTKKITEELEEIEGAEDGIEEPEVIDPPEIDSKYRLILLAAQRSKQLQRGAHPRVDLDLRKRKPTRVALKELEEKKVNFELLED
ncbi:MAG: DNA-directed RNA polymerase subunit omega [Acidobacteriota bacterium]|nr:MAG: DNA-directed RNA polymerase subunit omega [Acidobacteriota bacterium]